MIPWRTYTGIPPVAAARYGGARSPTGARPGGDRVLRPNRMVPNSLAHCWHGRR